MDNTNPIPEILDLLPLKEQVLDPKLLDAIRNIIHRKMKLIVSNEYILLLLTTLTEAKLAKLTEVQYPSTIGIVYFIQKEI